MEIAGSRRVNGMQCKVMPGQPRGQFARVLCRAVIEMPARAKQFDGGYSRARRFTHQGSCQLAIHEEVRGKRSLHSHGLGDLFMRIIWTLSEALNRVKAGPDAAVSQLPITRAVSMGRRDTSSKPAYSSLKS